MSENQLAIELVQLKHETAAALKLEFEGKVVRLGYLSQLWQYYAQRKNDMARQLALEAEIAKFADAEIDSSVAPKQTLLPATAPVLPLVEK